MGIRTGERFVHRRPVGRAARLRARRGATYLDEADDGWHARLNSATLELADGAQCVLGQLHGGFRTGLLRARILDFSSAPIASLSPVDLGFHARRDLGDEIESLDYAFRNRAWREELDRRRADEPAQRITRSAPRVAMPSA